MDKYIKQVITRLELINQKSAFHEDTILALFALIRQHLEANKLGGIYSTTAVYCNWCLHNELDRNKTAKKILRDISIAISDEKETLINDKINEILSFQTLRKELIKITNVPEVNWSLFSSHNGWKAFLSVLLKFLVEKPLVSTEQLPFKRFASELRLEVADISNMDKDYITAAGITANTVFWKIVVLPDRHTVIGSLELTEHPSEFK